MNQLFVSDLHLVSPETRTYKSFHRIVERSTTNRQEIYIIGDLSEAWIGDDDDSDLSLALTDLFRFATRNSPIYFLPGNRDFLLGARFAEKSGITLLKDPHLVTSEILITHGDAFCTDDIEYQKLRKQIRSEEWKASVLSLSLDERKRLATQMRRQSIAAQSNKADNIADVNEETVFKAVQKYGVSSVIHGHTHRPGIHIKPWGSRYVLGAWESCGWLLRREKGRFFMECFPLRGHYET